MNTKHAIEADGWGGLLPVCTLLSRAKEQQG
jgi:hypothetical protein